MKLQKSKNGQTTQMNEWMNLCTAQPWHKTTITIRTKQQQRKKRKQITFKMISMLILKNKYKTREQRNDFNRNIIMQAMNIHFIYSVCVNKIHTLWLRNECKTVWYSFSAYNSTTGLASMLKQGKLNKRWLYFQLIGVGR